jgi:hypothetical protein
MKIYLGNLTVEQLENRCGCKFEKEDFEWLKGHRQDNAEIKTKDKFHIFDIPFMIQTGADISNELIRILSKYNNKKPFEDLLQIGIVDI